MKHLVCLLFILSSFNFSQAEDDPNECKSESHRAILAAVLLNEVFYAPAFNELIRIENGEIKVGEGEKRTTVRYAAPVGDVTDIITEYTQDGCSFVSIQRIFGE